MFNYLKKAFGMKFDVPNYPLGAVLGEPDVRTIPYATVMQPKPLPLEYMSDVSKLPKWSQGNLGTCVPHAFAFAKMGMDHLETGEVTEYSRRFLYVKSRKFAGMPTLESNQGLFPLDCAKVMTGLGVIPGLDNDSQGLSHVDYIEKYQEPINYIVDANIARIGGFADGGINEYELKQAVYQKKFVPVTIAVDWDKLDQDGTFHAPQSIAGYHEITCIGWEAVNGGRFIFENWWDGLPNIYVNFSEMDKVIKDITVITDIPNDLIERAKATQYIFLADLKIGSTGDAVTQLQKRLKEYGLFPKAQVLTRNFGNLTKQAVLDYQRLKGIQQTGTVGPLTRFALNNDVGLTGTIKSKLDLFCEAIQDHEGYFAPSKKYPNGSRAYRNKSPGNLKFANQKGTIGKDKDNFAIFATYADGYMALRRMIENACLGLSKTYPKTLNFYEFFGIYAPSADNNNPSQYAEVVAKKLGVSPNTQIKDLLV